MGGIMSRQKLEVKTEDEMTEQLKILLNNGYDVAIHKNVNILCPNGDGDTYIIAYQKRKLL